MTSVDAFRARREQVLLRLLLRITRVMNGETVARMQAKGFAKMQPAFPYLLGNLDTGGTRIGALARRMGTSRQAVSQLSKEIEAAGGKGRAQQMNVGDQGSVPDLHLAPGGQVRLRPGRRRRRR